jgi:sulfate adenylyltransferase subunit 2
MVRLRELERITAEIFLESYFSFKRLGFLWSIGKDSTVALWIARKAFGGQIPFPVIHIDTSYKIPEMIQYRTKLALEWNLDLFVGQNVDALKAGKTFPQGGATRIECCRLLKTTALLKTVSGSWPRLRLNHQTKLLEESSDVEAFDAVAVGLRGDEEGSRSKERYISPRNASGQWDISNQPAELWKVFADQVPEEGSVRVHPILDWCELDIWQYIEQEKIPVTDLYFDHGKGTRYRSLGCATCTNSIFSNATSPTEIVAELKSSLANVAERSGRAQDSEDSGGLETLRRNGYM